MGHNAVCCCGGSTCGLLLWVLIMRMTVVWCSTLERMWSTMLDVVDDAVHVVDDTVHVVDDAVHVVDDVRCG